MASRVKPIVDLLVLCDEINYDTQTERYTIVHPWKSRRSMPTGVTKDFVIESLYVYSQVREGVGDFHLSIEVRNESNVRVARSRSLRHDFVTADRLIAKEFAFYLTGVKIRKPGLFRFLLLAGEAELEGGSRELWVLGG